MSGVIAITKMIQELMPTQYVADVHAAIGRRKDMQTKANSELEELRTEAANLSSEISALENQSRNDDAGPKDDTSAAMLTSNQAEEYDQKLEEETSPLREPPPSVDEQRESSYRDYTPKIDDHFFYHDLGYDSAHDDTFNYYHPQSVQGRSERQKRWQERGMYQSMALQHRSANPQPPGVPEADWSQWRLQYRRDKSQSSQISTSESSHATEDNTAIKEETPAPVPFPYRYDLRSRKVCGWD